MNSSLQRIGFIISFGLSCLFVFLPLVAISSSFIKTIDPQVSIKVDNIIFKLGAEDYYSNKPTYMPQLKFSLSGDFTPLFNWNTKELFLYIVLEYSTIKHSRNQIVIWDKIIKRGENSNLSIPTLKQKYNVADSFSDFYERNATLKLYWNTVPYVGRLFDNYRGEIPVKFPPKEIVATN